MKNGYILIAILVLFFFSGSFAQNIDLKSAEKIAAKFIDLKQKEYYVKSISAFEAENTTLAYKIDLHPRGFIIVPSNHKSSPVVAFSFTNNYVDVSEDFSMSDIYLRGLLKAYNSFTQPLESVEKAWNDFNTGSWSDSRFEQWPPQGTTNTGGWLEVNYKQSYPYNSMCPMDLNSGGRSLAGCPAVAMASILNYNKQINSIQFTDDDDYYHNYGSGNSYYIDDDYEAREFPSFPELNGYLYTLQDKYNRGEDGTQDEISALNFACGVACKQVYSASISGTFGIEQAYDAYLRFGFDSVKLIYDTDTLLNAKLADNIKAGLPAHIGLVDPGHTVGHNLIVDGYNTDEFYHLNFGWGGGSNGWYTMPPTSIPYNLTVIEGLIIDINLEGLYVGISEYEQSSLSFEVYPNPAHNEIHIKGIKLKKGDEINIYSVCGELVINNTLSTSQTNASVKTDELNNGLYFVELISGSKRWIRKMIKE